MSKITNSNNLIIIPCPNHKGYQLLKACSEPNCQKQAVFCEECERIEKNHFLEHRQKIKPISETIYNISKEISFNSIENKSIENLLIKEETNNIKKLKDHLIKQKIKIEEDFKKITESFLKNLVLIKNEVFNNIDKQLNIFTKNYDIFKSISHNNKDDDLKIIENYGNSNYLISKLKECSKISEISNLLNDLKKKIYLQNSSKISLKSSEKHTSKNIFQIEKILHNQLTNFPTYNIIKPDHLNEKIEKSLKKIEKLIENQLINYPFTSGLPMVSLLKNVRFPEKIEMNFEFSLSNKNLFLNTNFKNNLILNPIDKLETNHEKSINCILSLNNELIVTGSSDNTIRIWDIYSKKLLKVLYGHSDIITSLQKYNLRKQSAIENKFNLNKKYSEIGFLIISGSYDKKIIVWDSDFNKSNINTTKSIILRGHDFYITALEDLGNERNIISGDEKGTILLWDVLESKSIFKSTGKNTHKKMITCIIIINQLGKFVSSDLEGFIIIWEVLYEKNLKNGLEKAYDCKQLHILNNNNYGAVYNMVKKLDKNVIISCHEGKIIYWNIDKKKGECIIDDIQDKVHEIAIIENEDKFIVLCLLSNKHCICAIDHKGKIISAIKLGEEEDLISNTYSSNHKFQFIGNSKPFLAVVNQNVDRKNVNLVEIIF